MKEHVLETTFIKFEVDTTINTIDEMQVLLSKDSLKTWTKAGNIKEMDKKIYFRNTGNKQGLLYDFNLKLGDSINTVNTSLIKVNIKPHLPPDIATNTTINNSLKVYHSMVSVNF